MSVIFNCGFARVAVKESFRKVGSASIETDSSKSWKNYLAVFEGDSQDVFTVERSTYVKKSKAIYSSFRKMNSKARAQYQDTFSVLTGKLLIQRRRNSTHCQIVEVVRCTIMPSIIFSPVEKLSSHTNF